MGLSAETAPATGWIEDILQASSAGVGLADHRTRAAAETLSVAIQDQQFSVITSSLRALARRAGFGRLALATYYKPVSLIRSSIREGGPFEQWRTELGHSKMIEAARVLPQLIAPKSNLGYEVHYLSGEKYWYQTLFCAWSLQVNSAVRITPVVHDDGTLKESHIELLHRAIPWLRFVSRFEIERKLDRHLPEARFPELRSRRFTYPHLRKLTDIHCWRRGWTLVLDSDMLFFREPRFLLEWLASPAKACHMLDALPAYGYSAHLMEELCGHPIPPLVNVGLCGLRSDAIDWDELERWCKELVAREGMSYLLEQAVTAMLVAGKPRTEAPAVDYRVLPDLLEGREPSAVLHHYVAESKRSYFQHGWQRVRRACHAFDGGFGVEEVGFSRLS